MTDIFISLFNLSITASWLILAVVLLRIVFKKAPKAIRCILWALVGIRLVCPFSLESVFSLIPSKEVVSPDIIYSPSPSIDSGIAFFNNAVNNVIAQALTPAAEASIKPMQLLVLIASLLWAVGVAAMLIYALISSLMLKKSVSASVALRDNIRLCDSIKSPFILGIIKPKIYLPSDIDEAQTAAVIAHEMAHLKRRDHLWKPLGFLLLAVYWFNPLCWAAYILLCKDIELACDERVIKDMDIQSKKDYSNALLACSVSRRSISACPLAFGETSVKERVKSVLNYKKPAFWLIIAAAVACVVMAVCLLTNPIGSRSLSGEYAVSQNIYCDGRFSFYMTEDAAPTIEIDKDMKVSELKDGEILSSGLFEEAELSQENFGSLLNGYELWQNGESAESLQKQNEAAWCSSLQSAKDGVLPYMILRQNDGGIYIVYANVQGEKATGIRWIYALEQQEQQTSVEIDNSLAVFLDTTIANHHKTSGISDDPFVCIDYKILGTKDSGAETTLYMWVLYQEYSFDGEIHLDSGTHTPTAVTAKKTSQADGLGYELVEYWEPRDGSFYSDDIKGKFPSDLHKKALNSQWCIDEQEANCLKNAQQHFGTLSFNDKSADIPLTTIAYTDNPSFNASVTDGKSVDVPSTTVAETDNPSFNASVTDGKSVDVPSTTVAEKANPSFSASVLEVYDGSVLVEPFEGTSERNSSDKISVSLNVVSTNPVPNLKKGDKIRVVYNGNIAETYPAQIDTVFAIYSLD